MIIDIDCPFCYGLGRVHSAGCNGDPDDEGLDCAYCDGAGVVEHDLTDDLDDDE